MMTDYCPVKIEASLTQDMIIPKSKTIKQMGENKVNKSSNNPKCQNLINRIVLNSQTSEPSEVGFINHSSEEAEP